MEAEKLIRQFIMATTLCSLFSFPPVGRSEEIARKSGPVTANLSKATNILGSRWDNPATSPSLEAVEDPAEAEIKALPKTLVVDLKGVDGMPEKIEGVAIIDCNTIAISNDNDFDIEGNNAGKGVKNKILIIELAQPIPVPQITARPTTP